MHPQNENAISEGEHSTSNFFVLQCLQIKKRELCTVQTYNRYATSLIIWQKSILYCCVRLWRQFYSRSCSHWFKRQNNFVYGGKSFFYTTSKNHYLSFVCTCSWFPLSMLLHLDQLLLFYTSLAWVPLYFWIFCQYLLQLPNNLLGNGQLSIFLQFLCYLISIKIYSNFSQDALW